MGKMKPMKPAGGPPRPVQKAPAISPRPQVIARKPAMPVIPRPQAVAPRPAAMPVQHGANPIRIQAREIRRASLNQAANQQLDRVRPNVRPAAPPQKIMPKQPAPAQVRPMFVRPAIRPTVPTTGVSRPTQAAPARPPVPSAPPAGIRKPIPTPTASPRPSGLKSTYHGPTPPQPTVRPAVGGVAAATGAAVIGSLVLNSARANPQISSDVFFLNNSLSDLQKRSSLSQVQADVTELDAALNKTLSLLESARNKGYVYQKDIDETAYQLMDQWQPIRDQVLQNIPQQAAAFQNTLYPLSSQVAQLNNVISNPTAATPLLSNTSSQVNVLLSNIGQIEQSLQNSYADIKSQSSALTSRLNSIHWMLGQLAEAKFKLQENENIVNAVAARWDQVGDDDPEGILYLTNKRLIYERKEKVATKKVLFVTVAKELVQEVMIDQPLSAIQDIKASNRGLFGNQDFLEVQFADKKLDAVPFHLNGQDCKDWATMLQRAKSGDIESDRVTASGLSFADLTGPLTTADLMALQSDVNALQDVVTLKKVREELGNIENDMRSLERTLSSLRSRGYVIEKSLEVDVAVLATQWDRIKTNAETTLETQTHLLSEQMTSIQKMMGDLMAQSGNLNAARPSFLQVKSAIASTEAQADAADDTVIATYDQYADEVETLTAHLEWIGWMLDALSTASFQLLATESGVGATEAVWERPGLEPENGILFLTDQRLLWEDRVDAFELKLDMPLQQVTDVKKEVDEATGQEFLNYTLGSGAPYPVARFQLALPVADSWLKMVGRARAGDYTKDRAVEVDPAELERIRNAPRQCSNCGAGLTATILRGQTEITCEYCGQVIRI
jgi:hypothetical protein